MRKANTDVRQYTKKNGVFFWQVAQAMEISEATMTRRLRTELHELDKHMFFQIIDDLAKQSDPKTTKQIKE